MRRSTWSSSRLDGSTARQLTHTTGGATWPDVSPDGQTIVFVGYTADGYDLFTMPYPRARRRGHVVAAPGAAVERTRLAAAQASDARPTASADRLDRRLLTAARR